jgi:hypothetical protein
MSIFILHILNKNYFNFYYAWSNIFFCYCIFAINVIFFQKALQFKEVIILCYNRYNYERMSALLPPLLTWHICRIIVDFLGPIVFTWILN